mmetsp:Transcript_30814/g.47209  ORF Transcript_30814/g.47209 Transcript_30814/m.47209 type:complete len:241 (-) Transcript_30814:262-984(-)|eukprot:CAMPEP_0195290236 /NCGR_PEP_ID=MMETSP0707-20130614/6185_1 /TAXON_ID=33640 /ORGANISM="Asterionellopsis glacialis, Strain CCMP134" /LENGTH=240 /DNA_ID=CAMNT_0040350337 /DNA_START=294 /DNA_END=1016 /DNA_ORIENTATION=-
MIPAGDDVTLNIYDLVSDQETQEDTSSGNSSQTTASPAVSSFFQRILTPMGFGAYHTSIEVQGYCYTFSANAGIQKTQVSRRSTHVPRNGMYKESIFLGACGLDRGQINEVVNRLRSKFFTDSSYHLLNRNCNHFTETFATALIIGDQLADQNPPPLKMYPAWVNRLAKTSTNMIDHGDVCNVYLEARSAAGMDDKVGWDLSSSKDGKSGSGASQQKSGKKKELTEKQKAALAKLKRNKK